MGGFFGYLEDNKIGIFVFIACLFSIMFLVKWFASIFGLGRYSKNHGNSTGTENTASEYTSIGYIFADLAVKIINDFRHLLALIIVGIFGLTLAYVLYTTTKTDLNDSLQAVIAAFGGIVGTIIGYYFGESAAKGTAGTPASPLPETIDEEIIQNPPNEPDNSGPVSTQGMRRVRRPPIAPDNHSPDEQRTDEPND